MANPGFKIDVKSGPGITQSCVISTDRPLNFGRHRSNDCVLSNDPGISRQHFQIYYEAATCWIKDLNSRNGTYLNDHLVISSEIKNRDEIRVGSTRLIFALSDHSTPVETPTLADLGNQPLEPKTNLGIQNGDTTTIVMPRKLLAGKFSKREMLNEQLIDSFSRLPGRTILACNLERNKLIIEEGLEFEQVDKSRALLVSPSKTGIQRVIEQSYGRNSIVLLNSVVDPKLLAAKLKDAPEKFASPSTLVNNYQELPEEIANAMLSGINFVLCELEQPEKAFIIFDENHSSWVAQCVNLESN